MIEEIDNHIILDNLQTWPIEILNILDSAKDDIEKFIIEERRIDKLGEEIIEYRFDRPYNDYSPKWDRTLESVNSILEHQTIVGFHCTRLMDYEISDVLNNGLIPLNFEFAKKRINKLYDLNNISTELKNNLINKPELIDKSRVNRTFFFHCISTLKDKSGLSRLFKYWGGEAMYLCFENNTKLQEIGIPCIILASLKIKDFNQKILSLGERMICIYLNDNYYSHDFDNWLLKDKIPVIKIIKRSDRLFNNLTNINKWN